MNTPGYSLIVAHDKNLGIGWKNNIPFRFREDIKWFRTITTGDAKQILPNAVIMGRQTWESLPAQYSPLAKRINIVLSKNHNFQNSEIFDHESVFVYSSLKKAIQESEEKFYEVFVIGGCDIYKQTLLHCKKFVYY